MSERAITVRCGVCGIEVTGRLTDDGSVRPTNHPVRTEPVEGRCWLHRDDALPATPPASETVEAAWEALRHDPERPNWYRFGPIIERHRPRIEAAIRAEYEPDKSGFSPGCGPFNHPLTCKCPFVRRADSDERVAALFRAAHNVSDRRTLVDDGYWVSQKEMNALDAALDAVPEDAP